MWSINVTPKVNVFCAISSEKVYGPFFFAEQTVPGVTYLDMLQLWPVAQLQNIPALIFQQDGSPTHLHCAVLHYLNTVLPLRWIVRASGNDQPLMLWPSMSPDINPVIFSLGTCQRPGIRPTIATWPRWPKGTDHCGSEEYRCTHVDACGKNLNIVSLCAVSPVVHTANIYSCKKTTFSFLWLWTIPLRQVFWFYCYKCL